MWTIVDGPREYSPGEGDCALGWEYVIASQESRRTIRAELSETAVDSPSLPEQAETAIRTRGRSAIEPFLIRNDPPERVVISARGVYPG
jgi:hypothetical protein